jgi:geranylgeranyl diphosphate synthase type I
MNHPAVALENTGLLVERLHREFAAESLADLADGAAQEIPWRLWRQALYTPLHDFLSRPGKEFRGELLAQSWHLSGRKDPPPPELALVVEALHAGSLVIDDIEDESTERRGRPALHRVYGTATALNAGNWLYFWPFRLLESAPLAPEIRAAAHRLVTRVLLECHYGQSLDLSVRLADLEVAEIPGVVRAITELKTGSLVGLAAGLGALASGADERFVGAATRFGRELGTALQMLDDLSGVMTEKRRHKGIEDVALGRPTWPWAWLATTMERDAFAELQQMSRAVHEGHAPEPLARELGRLVAPQGKRRVHAHVEHAFARLSSAVTHPPALSALRLELERLERSYV